MMPLSRVSGLIVNNPLPNPELRTLCDRAGFRLLFSTSVHCDISLTMSGNPIWTGFASFCSS